MPLRGHVSMMAKDGAPLSGPGTLPALGPASESKGPLPEPWLQRAALLLEPGQKSLKVLPLGTKILGPLCPPGR